MLKSIIITEHELLNQNVIDVINTTEKNNHKFSALTRLHACYVFVKPGNSQADLKTPTIKGDQ